MFAASEHTRALSGLPRDRRQRVAGEAPLRDHAPRDVADLLQIVGRARRDFLTTVHKFFRDAAAERDGELALEELEGVEARLASGLVGREEREAARAVRPRDDRELRDGVVARDERGHDAVARLVVRD